MFMRHWYPKLIVQVMLYNIFAKEINTLYKSLYKDVMNTFSSYKYVKGNSLTIPLSLVNFVLCMFKPFYM